MPVDTSSIDYINHKVTDSSVVNMNATGQAYQGVANSVTLAVENTSNQLVNFSTIIQAGLAKALEKYMETKDPTWAEVITNLQKFLITQASSLKTVGQDAGSVMAIFGSLTQQKFSDILEQTNRAASSSPSTAIPAIPSDSSTSTPGSHP